MNIVCIIPARGGSKGIPNKNIIDFCGYPLITWSIEQARRSKYINKIYVSSDSIDILGVALAYEGIIAVKRPDEISEDNSKSESALIHAIVTAMNPQPDIVVFLQATSPIRETKDINNAITTLLEGRYDSVFSAIEAGDMLMWTKNPDGLESINYDYKNRQRRQDMEKQYIENGSIYVFRTESFLKTHNRLSGNIGVSIMEPWKVHEIDDYDSLGMCELIMKNKLLNHGK